MRFSAQCTAARSSAGRCSYPAPVPLSRSRQPGATFMATETAHPNALEKDHNLVADAARAAVSQRVHYEKRPVKGFDGRPVEGLYTAWIVLDNPTQFNSYTTDMIK